MERQAKRIDIVFENCEYFECPIEHINVCLTGITREISTWNGDGTTLDSHKAKEAIIWIDKEIFDLKSNFDEPLKERIMQFSDIVSVVLIFDDDTELSVYLPWQKFEKEEDDYINKLQKSEIIDDALKITFEQKGEEK